MKLSPLSRQNLSVAKINELLSMMDKHIKLAQQPGRTQAESDLELEEDLRKIPQYMAEIRAESKTQTKKFSGAESYLTRRVKRLRITVLVDVSWPLGLAGVAFWLWWSVSH
jgi:hypothetical protein